MTPIETSTRPWSFDDDIQSIVWQCGTVWDRLRGAKLFVTGGTGFIGRWMLESLKRADETLQLGVEATILTRSASAFARNAPHLANYGAFRWVEGDITGFRDQEGPFSHLIHAATDASADLNENDPCRMFDTVVAGTRRVLDFAAKHRIPRTLYLSSGAVYGQQPWEMSHVGEDWRGGPDCRDPRATYAEGKRAAEMLCSIYSKQLGIDIVTARIFALLGPMLDLDIHFAAGNFIRDAIAGREMVVQGDGRPVRSYLYVKDLTVWLWNLLARAEPGACYNVGSEDGISIADLAQRITRLLGGSGLKILGAVDTGWHPGRYVPRTELIRRDLGLSETTSLDEAILRTAQWNGWKHA